MTEQPSAASLSNALVSAVWLLELDDQYECGHGVTWLDECPEDCEAHRHMLIVKEALQSV